MKTKTFNQGFTLMETIVAMVLMVMIASAIAFILVPSTNTYSASMNQSQAQIIADTLAEEIRGELSYAIGTVTILDDAGTVAASGNKVQYESQKYGGRHMAVWENLQLKEPEEPKSVEVGEPGYLAIYATSDPTKNIAFDNNFYAGKKVIISFSGENGSKLIETTIEVLDAGGSPMLQSTTDMRLLNAGVTTAP